MHSQQWPLRSHPVFVQGQVSRFFSYSAQFMAISFVMAKYSNPIL
jgi:hypothetical protein